MTKKLTYCIPTLSVATTVILAIPVRYCPEKGVRKKALGGSLSILSTKLRIGTEEYSLSLMSRAITEIK